jgi:porin
MRPKPTNSFALLSRSGPFPIPSKGNKSSDLKTLSLVQICALFLFEIGVYGQEKSVLQGTSELATNLNAGAMSEQHTNAPTGPFGGTTGTGQQVPVNLRPFQLVLPREHLLGDWFGLRSKAEDVGISPSVTFVTDIAGNVTGGKSQGVTHADNLGLNVLFDLDKLAGLEGGSFLASVSQRSGSSLSSEHVGNVFTIQQVYGGQTFHLIDLAYQQRLLEDRVEFRLGRIATGDDFLVSPYNWLFMQNGFDGNPVGIFFNSPGMTAYPNATWGALLKVRPTERTYVMGGVYNGDPTIREIEHNGADMSMNGPLFAIGEAGYQRNGLPGDTGLLGDYRIGGWYDNAHFTDFETLGYGTPPATKRGNWGLYTLVDQLLISFGDRSKNSGLGICGSFLVSPDESVSQMPYFFTAGVVARGFLPSRPTDMAGVGVVYGHFSSDLQDAQERQQLLDPTVGVQDHETVLEWTYRLYFCKSAVFFQPDFQYIFRPGGTGKIDDAFVIGCQIGINF